MTCLLSFGSHVIAGNRDAEGKAPETKIYQGYSGGMMLHAGYLAVVPFVCIWMSFGMRVMGLITS